MIRVISVNVGQPQTHIHTHPTDGREAEWTSAFWKYPVSGAVRVTKLGVVGDAQADTKNHGGPDKAALGYASAHYPVWRAELPHLDLTPGGFGENLTIDGQDETSVCIGDIYKAGDLVMQVTGPRYPCWKISRRWNQPDLLDRVYSLRRTGWNFRVLNEGAISADTELILVDRPRPSLTIAHCFDVIDMPSEFIDSVYQLATAPEVATFWQKMATKALAAVSAPK
ncbi:MAG: MOSC domain-containing protein [Chloroflexi bacterium]|nr:MAG: MOSC domain-containing protein [Chloroflexi bacterium OLB13]MBC6955034.1 MOSC domain-containing protein [Chloroflexota bacterium]MBV6435486.1 hypothetical protein [Anaerolineae bacterium]MDL1914415.1 MOSC domain-containing protein [Anaerolineae bacterium CFX4]OQY83159.1 MAG: hypothetical protein B6D42_08170 [Anaerolineae bacterium UTCFX5]